MELKSINEKDIAQEDRVLELSLIDNYDNIDNIVLKYLNYYKEELNEERYNYCRKCGKEIKITKTFSPKYCNKCAKDTKQEQTNKCKREQRKKS